MTNNKFIFFNLAIFFLSLYVLNSLIPNLIGDLYSQYTIQKMHAQLKNENKAAAYLQSLKTPVTFATVQAYDQKHGTDLSVKLLSQSSYASMKDAIVSPKQFQNITSNNNEQISETTSYLHWFGSLIESAFVWISLTCLSWVINNFLDCCLKKRIKKIY